MLTPEQIKEYRQKYQIGVSSENALNIPPKKNARISFKELADNIPLICPKRLKISKRSRRI